MFKINNKKTRLDVYTIESNTHQNMCIKIDEDGYLMVKKSFTFEKVICVYNDLLDEEYNPYVLK